MYYNGTKGVVTKVTDLKNLVTNISSNTEPLDPVSRLSGGIISDLDLVWTFSGSVLRIFNVADGSIQSSWDFASIARDSRTRIRCVIEYPVCDSSRLATKENQICLIVSYTSKKDSSKISYISFCHPRTSRILHTITTREKVTCLSLIAPKKDHTSPLSGVVKTMSGAVALGTQSGNLLLLDIKDIFNYCRRNSFNALRNRFSEMLIFDFKKMSESEIKDRITRLDSHSSHVAVLLTDKKDSRDPDVEICALTYIPESTCLAVGLKNGSFQLWDVNTLKKLYKSPPLNIHTPVVGFGFQEPCNDPQNFCYLWVLYESEAKNESCLPFAVMYGILYKKVTSIPTYGRHYKNFVHCKKRFDLDVDLDRCVSGRCITSSVVSNTPSNILRHASVTDDASKINLFVMIFETWEHNADVNSAISVVVFDMNQWYKAQMPHQCYLGYAVPFINFMLLERASERKGSILDVRIKKDTIQQFLSFNLSEEYSYPSSLSFDTVFLSDSKVTNVRIPGAQRSVLERIISEGPIGLVNPSKYYTECREAGLRPCFLDTFNNTIVPSQIEQRNYILTILLENKISSFLVRCVKDWADGSRGVSCCTLPNLIQWAWECITRIKLTTDAICIPLFDYSGDDLDRENYQKLKHCVQLIHIIRDLLVYIYKNFKQFLLDDVKLKHQVDTLQLVTKYFDAIIWCLDCSMLPEKVSGSTDKCVPIYIVNILQYTEQRREELKRLGLHDEYFLIENASPLIVDAVLEREPKGKRLQMQWARESGGMTIGLYPPVTLQSLLRIFLLPDLSNDVKHFIMLYFLFDVCDYHRDEDMKEQLLSFSVIFSLDIAFFSLVQACWLLDHEKFEEAVDILTVDTVVCELRKQPLLYKTIMQSCVCQKQYGMGLKLERLVKLSGVVFPDERFYITLLLQNGLVMEAYTTLKKVSFGQKELLCHFFKVCDDFGLLKEIFKFPISVTEENEFMSYLDKSSSRDAGDLKIMYLLSRGRYVEAVDVNHNLASVVPKFDIVGRETTKQTAKIGRVTTRDLLVEAFRKTLPGVTNDLISFCRKEKDKIYRFKEVTKPTPLSVVVHTDTTQQLPTYKSSFEDVLHAAISKTAETWSSFSKLVKRKNFNSSVVKDTPFLRSDIMTPRKDASSLFSREKINVDRTKSDVEEPPAKRRKSVFNQTLDWASEAIENVSLKSPSVEVTKILSTPHVQKRLNKLLQSTPESSPLQSILKSSDISRFKQPQKVGFNVPQSSKPTSHKVAVIAETPVASTKSALKGSATASAVKKVIADHFSSSPQKRVDVIVENVAVTQQTKVSSPVKALLDSSPNADSYYSLESENELSDFVADDGRAKQSATTIQSNVSHQQTFIESMSEDEVAEASKRVILEVMSEEESAGENQSRVVVVDVHVEPPVHVSPVEPPISRVLSQRSVDPTTAHVDEPVADLSEIAVLAQPIVESFVGGQESQHEIAHETSQSPFRILNTFTLSGESRVVRSQLDMEEANASFATMQPVAAEPAYDTRGALSGTQPSWESIYEEYRSTNTCSSRVSEVNADKEENGGSGEEKPAAIASLEDDAESSADEEAQDENFQSQTNDSVTEIRDSSVDDDSDIEILEDESRIAPARKPDQSMEDLSTDEKDDDGSERSYESEYSYSQDSVEAESNMEENSIVDEDEEETADESDEEVSAETQEVEDEYEAEGGMEEEEEVEVDAEDEYEDEDEEECEEEEADTCVEEEEQEIEKQPLSKEKAATDEPVEEASFDAEALCRDNPAINLEELKKIVSNVAAVEAKSVADLNPSVETVKNCDLSIASPSLDRSENDFSICEVYEQTPSVLEETVNLEYSDTFVQKGEVTVDDSVVDVSEAATTAEKIDETANDSQKMAKESSEPHMVFYFGENSVTSIGDEMLMDDSANSKSASLADLSNRSARGGELYESASSNAVIASQELNDMEVEEASVTCDITQSESVYIVDIESEISLDEEMVKNRSLVSQASPQVERSSIARGNRSAPERENLKTESSSVSTPEPREACIRAAIISENRESTSKIEESVLAPSSTSEPETPISKPEPRMSVITETASPKTSAEVASPAFIGFPSPKRITKNTVSSEFNSDRSSINLPSSTLLHQSPFTEKVAVEASQENLTHEVTPLVKASASSTHPLASGEDSSPGSSETLSATHSTPAQQSVTSEDQITNRTDIISSSDVTQSSPKSHLSPLKETYFDNISQSVNIQKCISPHLSCTTAVKTSPTEQVMGETIFMQEDSLQRSVSPVTTCESSARSASVGAKESIADQGSREPCKHSSVASLRLSPLQQVAEEANQSISGQQLRHSRIDSQVSNLGSSPSRQVTDDANHSVCVAEPSSLHSDGAPLVSQPLQTEVTTEKANQTKLVKEHSDSVLETHSSSEVVECNLNRYYQIEGASAEIELSPVGQSTNQADQLVSISATSPATSIRNLTSTADILNESSFIQNQAFPKAVKPLVAYTPSPSKQSFSESIRSLSVASSISAHRQPTCEHELEKTPEVMCISSSTSPSSSVEKTSILVSPSVSNQSSVHTPVSISSSRSIVTDVGKSSPASTHILQTPENVYSAQSSVQILSPLSCNSSIVGSPQMAIDSSSPEVYDATYNSHVGVHRLRDVSETFGRVSSSPPSSVKGNDFTLIEQQVEANQSPINTEAGDQEWSLRVTPSPRRSVRLARRLSMDSTTLDAVLEEGLESSRSPVQPVSRTSRRRRSSERLAAVGIFPISEAVAANKGGNNEDDASSVKSAASAAESVSSRTSTISTRSQTQKRSSFTRFEMRKSSMRPSYRPLQVIVSDEEMSPTKSEVGAKCQNVIVERKYASSEPGDLSSDSRRSKRSRVGSAASSNEEDDRLNTVPDRASKRTKRSTKSQSEKNLLNAAMLATPTSQKSRSKKFVSSTPMKSDQEQTVQAMSTAAVSDYTMSRRVTRFQKTLLEGGLRRGEQSDHIEEGRKRTATPSFLKNVTEETELDSEHGTYDSDGDAELTTRAVRDRTIQTRASDIRASRGSRPSAAHKSVSSSSRTSGAIAPTKRSSSTTSSSLPSSDQAPPDGGSSDDGSVSSRASTSSRRKGRPSTFTKMELRRSSVRPHFKPLSVIASDEESASFPTPPRPSRSSPEEDGGALSSSESMQSLRTSTRRLTRAGTRSGRNESDQSDHETSSVSDVSSVSTVSRRTRRSLAADLSKAEEASAHTKEIPAEGSPAKKRITKTQATSVEPSVKEIPKKRKRT